MNKAYFSHGHVGHARIGTHENSFKYPIYNFLFCCEHEDSVFKMLRSKFWNLLGIQATDYLAGEAESFQLRAKEFLKRHCHYEADEIWLQTMPRMFGYAFNPVSFWFCKRDGQLEAVLAEVNNTFGERHFYWLHIPGLEIQPTQWLRAEKVFHVSPFYPVEGYYEFRFQLSNTRSRVDIIYFSNAGKTSLVTWIEGTLHSLEEQSFVRLLVRYGWMTPLVVVRIHWQALNLWRKKVKFFTKPEPPSKEVT